MDRTVRFRLTDEDLDMLRELAENDNFSVTIRRLIQDAYLRRARRMRQIP
jgi:hypothetical protein